MERKNKGTGAGGLNTNKNGLNFEDVTNTHDFLLNKFQERKMDRKNFFYKKDNKTEIYWFTKKSKSLFTKISKEKLNIKSIRNPDESILIIGKDKIDIFIIEKKNQNTEGSVDIKLWASPTLKREYVYIFNKPNITVHYILTLNNWLYTKFESDKEKWKFLRKEFKDDIYVFNGNDKNYFEKIYKHIFP